MLIAGVDRGAEALLLSTGQYVRHGAKLRLPPQQGKYSVRPIESPGQKPTLELGPTRIFMKI